MKQLPFILILLLLCASCKREKSQWDIEIITPMAITELSINDILPDSIISTNDDGLISIIIDTKLIELKADTLLAIKDTVLQNGYTLPAPLISLEIQPGLPFPILPSELSLNTGNDIEIKEAKIEGGEIVLSLTNPLETPLVVIYILPGLTLEGAEFHFQDTLPAGTNTLPSVTEKVFELSNYVIDLTGDGYASNTLIQSIAVINSSEGNLVTATVLDTIGFQFALHDLVFSYARGYFGSFNINEESEFDLSSTLNLNPENILFDEVALNFEILNGLGVDFRIINSEYNAINTAESIMLTMNNDPLTGNINIDRAFDLGDRPEYSSRVIELDENNSNITDILSLAPDAFNIAFNLDVNPLGNISSSNDFIYKDDGIIINAALELPLSITISDLTLKDSLKFNFQNNGASTYEGGELTLHIDNGFPVNIDLEFLIIDKTLALTGQLETNFLIPACDNINNDCSASHEEFSIHLKKKDITTLSEGGRLVITGTFNSDGKVDFKPNQSLKIQAVIDADINVGL